MPGKSLVFVFTRTVAFYVRPPPWFWPRPTAAFPTTENNHASGLWFMLFSAVPKLRTYPCYQPKKPQPTRGAARVGVCFLPSGLIHVNVDRPPTSFRKDPS